MRAPRGAYASFVAIALDTLRALAAPRRLLPILVVTVPLLVVQAQLSADPCAVPLAAAMGLAFVLTGPAAFRALVAERPAARAAGGLAAYALLATLVVLVVGALVPALTGLGPTFLTEPASLSMCVALYLAGGWGLGRDVGFEATLARARCREAELTREARQAQLLALRAHLDPHFLFNTLNAIAEWCRQDGEVAERAVLRLAALLRTLLAGVHTPAWSLARELELVESVLELHRLRDPGRSTLVRRLDAAADHLLVLPLVLLPLAENAVKHGPAAGHLGEITLTSARLGDRLEVTLENPGPCRGPRTGSHGLPTLQARLELAYEGGARLELRALGERTRAVLVLPAAGPRVAGPS